MAAVGAITDTSTRREVDLGTRARAATMSETTEQLAVDAETAAKMLRTCQMNSGARSEKFLPLASAASRCLPTVAELKFARHARRKPARNSRVRVRRMASIYQRRREKKWCTYFVRGASLIKIGRTKNWRQRMRALRVTCPVPLHCIGLILEDREKELHARFAHLRVRDEWFRSTRELLDFIKSTDE